VIFRRHNGCRGFRIWKWGQLQIELWFCKKGELIAPHVHERIDSTIVFLAGDMYGKIDERGGILEWPADMFRTFKVPAGVRHGAEVGSFCIFANVERWTGEPTSACEDFTAV
jgi:hypothetical protein